MIELGIDIVTDLAAATSMEWLETNGIGGYASGTVSGAHTRRYHGLLIAATRPPLGRAVLLSKLEETIVVDGERFELSVNQYPRAVHPTGHKYLTDFRLDPFPIWAYEVAGLNITKKIFMWQGSNATVITWSIGNKKQNDKRSLELEVRPLIAFRDHHHLRRESDEFEDGIEVERNSVSFRPVPHLPRLRLIADFISVEKTGHWYRNFEYSKEQERGFDFQEDLFQPCVLHFDLMKEVSIIASTETVPNEAATALEKAEIKRREGLDAVSKLKGRFLRRLAAAADQFIVDRGDGKTVIAGYHWFSDWGRDTMIALPGLTLATSRPGIAKSILAEFSKHISEGMLPNRFPDIGEEPEYNTVDATLWFFEAIRAYLEKTKDEQFVLDTLYAKLVDIIDWHVRGTRHKIHVDTDGLLYAGEPGVQLTWMDAKVGDHVITPRSGKAVEIQALWFNALLMMSQLADGFNDTANASKFSQMAEVAKASFNGQFWNASSECLYDVIDGDEKDGSIRPNQILAVSLRHSMLDAERARKVVDRVQADLLTPFGLRTLSPNDPRYVPIYIGSPLERDSSYHQGTVWGWLIGPFVDAYRRTHINDGDIDAIVKTLTAGFQAHLRESMLGQVCEIFDAEPPHAPRGCAAQAWSVAEILRVTVDR